MGKYITKEMVEEASRIASFIVKEAPGYDLINNNEVKEFYNTKVEPKLKKLKKENKDNTPNVLMSDFLKKTIQKKEKGKNYTTHGQGSFRGYKLKNHVWAPMYLGPSKQQDKKPGYKYCPQLFISINKTGIQFGLDYGNEPEDKFVKMIKESDHITHSLFKLLKEDEKLLFTSREKMKEERIQNQEEIKKIQIQTKNETELKDKWGETSKIIKMYHVDHIPSNIEEKIEETLEKLFPIFDAISQQDDSIIELDSKNIEIEDGKLGEPFDKIFPDYKEAYDFFDLIEDTFEKLNINDPSDKRFSVTIPKDKNLLRLNAGNFAALHFVNKGNHDYRIGMALLEEAKEMNSEKIWYPFNSFESKIIIIEFNLRQFKEQKKKILNIFYKTLSEIKNKINNWTSSSFRNYNQPKIVEMVFNKDKREKILKEGIKIFYETKTWKDIKEDLGYDFDNSKSFKINDVDHKKEELIFPKKIKSNLERQITKAVRTGHHIILIGPPGTGKSKLAKQICKFYTHENFKMSTATSDWSTFDTIGGYRPVNKGSELQFRPGLFLKCFQDNYNQDNHNVNINKWLIIDEINRADIDKAFGSLFSALSGDTIEIPFEDKNGNSIKVIGKPDDAVNISENHFIIHPDWRIIATMNTYDKASLYEMSYAFMRRFAFIPVEIPDIKNEVGFLHKYIEVWNKNKENNLDSKTIENLFKIWKKINKTKRKIGPAIIKDIYEYVIEEKDFVSAIIMYVLPQFEGLTEKDLKEFYNNIKEVDPSLKNLKKPIEDFFMIKLAD